MFSMMMAIRIEILRAAPHIAERNYFRFAFVHASSSTTSTTFTTSATATNTTTNTTITYYGCIICRVPALFSEFLVNLWLMPSFTGLCLLLGLLPKKHPSKAYLNLNHLPDVLACQPANKKTYLAQNLICETSHQLISTSRQKHNRRTNRHTKGRPTDGLTNRPTDGPMDGPMG